MGIRVECDWCRQAIAAGEPYATVEIDGKIGQTSISEPARVYCGSGRKGTSCASRVLGVLEGNPVGRVDMGFEWRLVPVEGESRTPASKPVPNVPTPRAFDPNETVMFGGEHITAELDEFIRSRVSSAYAICGAFRCRADEHGSRTSNLHSRSECKARGHRHCVACDELGRQLGDDFMVG